ncbi:MAG: ABC transporter substrate-binding protein [Pseudomonadota bacterium]
MKRRTLLAGIGAVAALGATAPYRALALEASAAESHVQSAVREVLDIVQGSGDAKAKAAKLKSVMESRAAMPQIARFAAGQAWRDMSDAQQGSYSNAFSHFLSTVYARRFQGYAGETISVQGVVDESRKGSLVRSTVTQPSGAPIVVEWLVTDRPGRVVIADIVIEGVSLLLTQRDEVAGMLRAHGGDVDKLIADLNSA